MSDGKDVSEKNDDVKGKNDVKDLKDVSDARNAHDKNESVTNDVKDVDDVKDASVTNNGRTADNAAKRPRPSKTPRDRNALIREINESMREKSRADCVLKEEESVIDRLTKESVRNNDRNVGFVTSRCYGAVGNVVRGEVRKNDMGKDEVVKKVRKNDDIEKDEVVEKDEVIRKDEVRKDEDVKNVAVIRKMRM